MSDEEFIKEVEAYLKMNEVDKQLQRTELDIRSLQSRMQDLKEASALPSECAKLCKLNLIIN